MPANREHRGRPTEDDITDAQQRALTEVKNHIARKGYPPTMNELGALLGITAASAHQLIVQLERKGFVKREPLKARSLTILREPRRTIDFLIAVPLVGTVKAGPAMLAEENRIGEVLVEMSVTNRGRCFALTVSGDSMIGAGMREGDVVIVRQQPIAESGEIVVALIDDEATVKRLFIHGDHIELRAENRRYKPMLVGPETEFRILGKVIAVRHA
ncbi:MAG: repressor LexA [Planctomycetota bacterium]|nr:MAG: repressor LexA [Planctomycetota bacterium]